MYLIVEKKSGKKFKFLYAVFDDEIKAKEHLQKLSNQKEKTIEFYENLKYPFFLVEEFDEKHNNDYCVISMKELENKINSIKIKEDTEDDFTVYFNLWRIDKNSINKRFPNEPILNGIDTHFHFTNTYIEEIKKNGFDNFWKEIINNYC